VDDPRIVQHHAPRLPASMERTPMLVVIDGPAGAGKTTIARTLARALAVPLLDTGAIYRSLALLARERGVAWDDEPGLVALARELDLRLGELPEQGPQPVLLGARDVTAAIRTPDIAQGASQVSAWPQVRAALLPVQRELGARGCVAEGRDMGTVVFPDAPHKFFLTAELPVRAARRRAELELAGADPAVVSAVEGEMATRDARDAGRAVAPLRPADDAVHIDSSQLGADEVVSVILARIRGQAR
jgi:CMP/dCMP kinase